VGNEIRLADRSLTLRLRRDAFVRDADKQRISDATKAFLADAFRWAHDDALMRQLCGLLGFDGALPPDAGFKVRRAIETGDIVAIPDAPRYTGAGSSGSNNPKPSVATFTPSQLFRGASRIASAGSYYAGRTRIQMPPNDWLTIWQSRPGDVLPDGSIAVALNSVRDDVAVTVDNAADDIATFSDDAGESTPLYDAQPFDYQPDMPDMPDGDSFDIAKTPNQGDPGTWYTNPGSGQMRMYGNDGQPVVDFDFDHDHGQGIPHAYNWDGGVRGPGVSFPPL